ncbi:MAG: peptidase M14 [Acidobacteria bacterium]|nr:peptidase M14 [Acidobacteriota bacterium]
MRSGIIFWVLRLALCLSIAVVLGLLVRAPGAETIKADQLWNLWPQVRVWKSDPFRMRHGDLQRELERLQRASGGALQMDVVGRSAEGRSLTLVQWGSGRDRVFLWSQMHGDEPTATTALLDIMNFLTAQSESPSVQLLRRRLSLLILPMLNPDGAERTRRRNSQGIDINRDALALTTPEGRTLKFVHEKFRPHYGFNLHNQNRHTGVGDTRLPVTLALLAVPFDKEGSNSAQRLKARQVCTILSETLSPYCKGQISRYDDAFNVRAFGDQISASGTATVLLESGWPGSGGEEFLVRLNFVGLVSALLAIAEEKVDSADPSVYDRLKQNQSGGIFDWVFQKVTVWSGDRIEPFKTDVAVNFSDVFNAQKVRRRAGMIAEVGDLSIFGALKTTAGEDWVLTASALGSGSSRSEVFPGGQNLYVYKKRNAQGPLSEANLSLYGYLKQGEWHQVGPQ